MNNKKDFKFSVIMAVYNAEIYMEKSIDSLINQTLSFKDHIQLILVNDGSTDRSEEIALSYQKKYPDNIVVVSKENEGVAIARNMGLKYALGDYINYMDSDDLITSDTFEEVLNFFSKYPIDDYDFVAIPVEFFDMKEGGHYLNFRFDEVKGDFVNVLDFPNYIQVYVHSVFIKKDSIGDLEFESRLVNMSDGLFITKLLMNKNKYGLVKNPKYLYRKPYNSSSITGNLQNKKGYYTERFKYLYMELIEYSIDKYGFVPDFVQNVLIYDLRWLVQRDKFKQSISNVMNKDEINEFFVYLDKILSYIDMDVLKSNVVVPKPVKNFLIYLKNKEFHIETKGRIVLFKSGDELLSKLNKNKLWIDIIELKDGFLNISGSYASLCDTKAMHIEAIKWNAGKKSIYKSHFYDYKGTTRRVREFLSIPWFFYYSFDFKIPISNDEVSNMIFKVVFDEDDANIKMNGHIFFRDYAGLSEINPYFVKDSKIVLYRDNRIYVENYSYIKRIKNEYKTLSNIFDEFNVFNLNIALYRIAFLISFVFLRNKKVWIFMDRDYQSGDNGEHLFDYSVNQKDSVKKYFAIKEDSSDYKRLKKKYGRKVIKYGSRKHKLLYLLSQKIISSQIDIKVLNPFIEEDTEILNYYNGLLTANIYFLQHGIPRYAMGNWLRKFDHNVSLIVATSLYDYDSYLKYYNYEDDVIQILGYPRYDNLTNKNLKKQILVLFSWRHYITNRTTLIKSEYFKRFNSLINNKKLINSAKEYGYEIIVKMHPLMVDFIDEFDINKDIILDESSKYHDLICESQLLITDCSSIAFDFAYLKKPVVYYQYGDDYHFDVKTCYFDENSDIGPIYDTEDDLVENILDYLKTNCQIKDKFDKNINNFFKYQDKNNSKRCYEWIKKH